MNAYFYIVVAVELPDGSGCPFTFGPASAVFSLRPQNDEQGSKGSGLFHKWSWFIEG